jgi:hypothetical protein
VIVTRDEFKALIEKGIRDSGITDRESIEALREVAASSEACAVGKFGVEYDDGFPQGSCPAVQAGLPNFYYDRSDTRQRFAEAFDGAVVSLAADRGESLYMQVVEVE